MKFRNPWPELSVRRVVRIRCFLNTSRLSRTRHGRRRYGVYAHVRATKPTNLMLTTVVTSTQANTSVCASRTDWIPFCKHKSGNRCTHTGAMLSKYQRRRCETLLWNPHGRNGTVILWPRPGARYDQFDLRTTATFGLRARRLIAVLKSSPVVFFGFVIKYVCTYRRDKR